MRVLLDECVPWPMHKVLVGHDCTTAQKRGWGGLKNGDLLRQAEVEFDLFITSDQNMRYQQNLAGRQIAILELRPTTSTASLPLPRSSMLAWLRSSPATFSTWRFRDHAMSITVENELATIEEAPAILLEKMPASKVARLLATLQVGTAITCRPATHFSPEKPWTACSSKQSG